MIIMSKSTVELLLKKFVQNACITFVMYMLNKSVINIYLLGNNLVLMKMKHSLQPLVELVFLYIIGFVSYKFHKQRN